MSAHSSQWLTDQNVWVSQWAGFPTVNVNVNELSLTLSLKLWFSACAAASSLSLSLSFSCVFSQVLCQLFVSSLVFILFWQFSRRDFCKGNLFFLSSQHFFNVDTCVMYTTSSQVQLQWLVTCRPMLAEIRELFIWSNLSMAAVRTLTSDSRLLRCELAACRNKWSAAFSDSFTASETGGWWRSSSEFVSLCYIFHYPEFLWKLLHWLLHSSKLPIHPLPHLLQRISHLDTHTSNIQTWSTQQQKQPYRDVCTLKTRPLGCVKSPLTSLMYLISSWRWLTVHPRAITSCCLSEPVLRTTAYTLGPWCCSEDSGTPLVMSPRCWGRQDHTGQVSVATLQLRLTKAVTVFVYLCACSCADMHTCRWITRLCVYAHACVKYTWSGISSTTAAEHWKQEVGREGLEKVQSVFKVSCFCNPVHELLLFLSIVSLTARPPLKMDACQHRSSAAW